MPILVLLPSSQRVDVELEAWPGRQIEASQVVHLWVAMTLLVSYYQLLTRSR